MRVLPMGPTAVVVDELSIPPAAVARALRRRAVPGLIDVVPAASTVLVTVQRPESLDVVVDALRALRHDDVERAEERIVEIPAVYDGEDLAVVADRVGLRVDEVIERHAGTTFRVAFCGFAPGFAYLDGLPPELHLPRRPTPRTRVPAGAVAIAAGYSAVYPTVSPGGWHLLARTDLVLFDVRRDPPALLTPGTAVRFVAA